MTNFTRTAEVCTSCAIVGGRMLTLELQCVSWACTGVCWANCQDTQVPCIAFGIRNNMPQAVLSACAKGTETQRHASAQEANTNSGTEQGYVPSYIIHTKLWESSDSPCCALSSLRLILVSEPAGTSSMLYKKTHDAEHRVFPRQHGSRGIKLYWSASVVARAV